MPPTKNGQIRSVLEQKKAKNRPKKRTISVHLSDKFFLPLRQRIKSKDALLWQVKRRV